MSDPAPPGYSQQEWRDQNPGYPLSALRMRHIEAGIAADEAFTLAVEEYLQDTLVPLAGAQDGLAFVGTGASEGEWSATATVDTTDIPQPLGVATPGTGTNGASAEDHVHAMPATTQLADVEGTPAAGQAYVWNGSKFVPASVLANLPLWLEATNGELTLPRGASTDLHSFYPSGVELSKTLWLTYFRCLTTRTVGHIEFGSGGQALSSGTLAELALFSVNESTNALTLLSGVAAASVKTALEQHEYQHNKLALEASHELVAGQRYAIGLLQVFTGNPGAIVGGWDNEEFQDGRTPRLSARKTGVSAMPSSVTDASLEGFNLVGEFFLTA